jgi:hypothetical protein
MFSPEEELVLLKYKSKKDIKNKLFIYNWMNIKNLYIGCKLI